MSVSKLESLPNEILLDLFEKYINGIDVINAFAFQLNRRVDVLIVQARRFRFDFIRCRKDDFRVCMGLLPAYVDKIEELVLAERNTPGQIHAFLSLYPSFAIFKNLRKLYLQVDIKAVDPMIFGNSLQSLAHIALHTLSFTVSSVQVSKLLENIIREMFYIKTLKKLSIDVNFVDRWWDSLKESCSNVEYLKVRGTSCACTDLQYIFRCAPALRYLTIEICRNYYREYPLSNLSLPNALPCMSMLHTVIFSFQYIDSTMLDLLKIYLKYMPSLKCLEIKVKNHIRDVFQYETFIQTTLVTLPSLTSFILCITIPYIQDENVSNILAFTGKSDFIKNERFSLIINDFSESTRRRFDLNASNWLAKERWSDIVFRWNTNLDHTMNDKQSALNRISKLYLFPQCHSSLHKYYLNNVTHLFIDELDDQLFTYITTYINCSRIQHLDLLSMRGSILIFPMLEAATNLRSLRINFRLLHDDLIHHSRKYENVQSLVISTNLHTFNDEDIFLISEMFPQLEHLIIHTKDLGNVPMLETHLLRLRRLTFCCADLEDVLQFDGHEDERFHDLLRTKAKIFFQRNEEWVTVWIDRATLRDSYWQMFVKTDNSTNSASGSFMKKTLDKIFSFFK